MMTFQSTTGSLALRAAAVLLILAGFSALLAGTSIASAQGVAPDKPDRPTGTAVFRGGVDLEWNQVPEATSYDVQLYWNDQWIDLPGDGVEIAFYGAGAIISQLNHQGGSYFFQVRANNRHGSSDWSDYLSMNPTSNHESGRRDRPDNVSATGAPTVSGTPQVGATITASISDIADGNGLDRVKFSYQWISNDGSTDTEIQDANDAAYTLQPADVGKTIKVRVSFTDRGGYAEALTSVATEAVAVGPSVASLTVKKAGLLTASVTVNVTAPDGSEVYLRYRDGIRDRPLEVLGRSLWTTQSKAVAPGESSVEFGWSDVAGTRSYTVEASYDSTFATGTKTIRFTNPQPEVGGPPIWVSADETTTTFTFLVSLSNDDYAYLPSATELRNASFSGRLLSKWPVDAHIRYRTGGGAWTSTSIGLENERIRYLYPIDGASKLGFVVKLTGLTASTDYEMQVSFDSAFPEAATETFSITTRGLTISVHSIKRTEAVVTLDLISAITNTTTYLRYRTGNDDWTRFDGPRAWGSKQYWLTGLTSGTTYEVEASYDWDFQPTSTRSTTFTTLPLTAASDATLSGLALSDVDFGTFDSATTEYTADVDRDVMETTVTPTVNHDGATYVIKLDGVADSDETVVLAPGSSVITIEVTSGDRETIKTYTVTATRTASSDATLADLAFSFPTTMGSAPVPLDWLDPSEELANDVDFGTFDPATTEYTGDVDSNEELIRVTPTVNHGGATYTVKYDASYVNYCRPARLSKVGLRLIPAQGVDEIFTLASGSNVITIEVTSEDGQTIKTYTVALTSAASAVATLSSLHLFTALPGERIWFYVDRPDDDRVVDIGEFSPSTTEYTADVENDISKVVLGVEAAHHRATCITKLDGVDARVEYPLSVGDNVITVEVTADDGETTKTYTITVTRAEPPLSTDAALSGLTLSGIDFGAFDAATITYTASVGNDVSETTVTPTTNDDGATYAIKLDGTADEDGTVALAVGENVITVEVAAEDGQATSTYTVTVTRAASGSNTQQQEEEEEPGPEVTVALSSPTAPAGTAVDVTMSFANLESDSDASTKDYVFRADVKDSNDGDVDQCEDHANGYGLGVDRYMYKVDQDPEVRTGTISADCPVGAYTLRVSISTADNVELASESAAFTVVNPGPTLSNDATLSGLTLSGVDFGTFASATTGYTASVTNDVAETTVTPTVNDDGASYVIKLDGMTDGDGSVSLAVGSNVITIEVTAEDSQTTRTYTVTVTRAARPLSADATLKGLTLSGVDIGTFASSTFGYGASVANNVVETTVTPTTNDDGATYVVKLGGVVDNDGAITLALGGNIIAIEVTAEDGQTTKTYTVTVTRAASGPAVTVALSPSDSVEPGTEITVTMSFDGLEADSDTSTIDYIFRTDVKNSDNGDADACEDRANGYGLGVDRYMHKVDEDPEIRAGSISADCPPGDYTVRASISSQENVELASATADFSITEPETAPSNDATLSGLTLSGVDFGAFDPDVTGYTADVGNDVTETTVTPTTNDDGASYAVKLDGVADDDGTVSLAVGSNVITIEVTAEDGQTTKTYTVTVTRAEAPASNTPASGAPAINGTAQVGETLTADTSSIEDADGLSGATFSYQWISNDGTTDTEIQDATDSTYTLSAADEGKTIKVRVTFTDDANNEETLTSTATASVAAEPSVASLTLNSDPWVVTAAVTVNVTGANGSEVHLRYRKGSDDWTTESKAVASGDSSVEFVWSYLTGARTYTVEASYDSTFATGVRMVTFTTAPPEIQSAHARKVRETTATIDITVVLSNGDDIYLRYRTGGGAWTTTSKAANPDPVYHSNYVPPLLTWFGIPITGLTASTEYEVQVSWDSTFPAGATKTFTFTTLGLTVSVDSIEQTTAMVTVIGTGLDSGGANVHLRFRTGSGAWTVDRVLIPVNRDSVRFQLAELTPGTTWELEVSYDSDFRATSTRSTTFTTLPPTTVSDATLRGLELSNVDFGTFDPAITEYTAEVDGDVQATTVTPKLKAERATYAIKLDGVADADGVIPLDVGGNVITVEVTAEDGNTAKTYTVTVTRTALPPAVAPDSPDAPTGSLDGAGNASLDWNDVETATGYEIGLWWNGEWTTLPNDGAGLGVSISGSGATVTGLPTYWTVYYFRVRAVNEAGTSDWSLMVKIEL